jgi:hypothetical protein
MSILDQPSDIITANYHDRRSRSIELGKNDDEGAWRAALLQYLDEREHVIVNHQLAAANEHIETLAGRLHVSQTMREQFERFWNVERAKSARLEAEIAILKAMGG